MARPLRHAITQSIWKAKGAEGKCGVGAIPVSGKACEISDGNPEEWLVRPPFIITRPTISIAIDATAPNAEAGLLGLIL